VSIKRFALSENLCNLAFMKIKEKAALRAKAAEMIRTGYSTQEVAIATNFSPQYVRIIARNAGIRERGPFPHNPRVGHYPTLTKEERAARTERMRELYAGGMTLAEIGKQFDMTRERVRQLLAEIGVSRSGGGAFVRAGVKRIEKTETRNVRIERQFRCTPEQYRIMLEAGVGRPYNAQRRNARIRGIEWNLTRWEWWEIWSGSGVWEQRGRTRDRYVMCRVNDIGPYAVGNVFIATASDNLAAISHNRRLRPIPVLPQPNPDGNSE
jgi:DNA-binding CsgD family transcriptional regulator